MSGKTRRERREAEAQLPTDTDWLWSCPVGMPLRDIARKLRFAGEPQTELSARAWADDLKFRDDLYRALLVPSWPWPAPAHVVWDALDDDLVDACDDGRLIVLRDLNPDLPKVVQMLIDIIGTRRRERGFHMFESRDGARFALVLEGWDAPTVSVRSGHKTTYTVERVKGGRLATPGQEAHDASAEP